MANWVRCPHPFSERFPLKKHIRGGDGIPPHKGYLSDTCAIPYEIVRYSALRYYLERVLRDMMGVSRTGPLSPQQDNQKNPRAHKNTIGTFPHPKPKILRPLKTRNFMGMGGFPAERTQFFQAPIRLAQPFPAPESRANIFMDTRIFVRQTPRKQKHQGIIIICGKITNLTRNSMKTSFFPGHFERTNCFKNHDK